MLVLSCHVALLKACISLQDIEKGSQIHADIARNKSLQEDLYVGTALLDMYANCGCLAEAEDILNKFPSRNIFSWAALMGGYSKHKLDLKVINCFQKLCSDGIVPNVATSICSLKACGSVGSSCIEKAQQIHDEIMSRDFLQKDIVIGNALVDMYAKCGSLVRAQEVFDMLPERNVITWGALITAYSQLGRAENTLSIFNEMIKQGNKPDRVVFLSILNACSHAGMIDNGQTYFEAMSRDYDIVPTIEHYICMVDTLGRLGQLDKAVGMVSRMPFFPDLATWGIILCACKHSGNVHLGKEAFQHAIHLNENDPAAYVLISQIYADTEADV